MTHEGETIETKIESVERIQIGDIKVTVEHEVTDNAGQWLMAVALTGFWLGALPVGLLLGWLVF